MRHGDFLSAKDTLFGEEFQASLTTKVERDSALSKAVSITKRNKKQHEPPFSRKEGQWNDRVFFSRGPSCQVWRQAGQKLLSVQSTFFPEEGDNRRGMPFRSYQRPAYRPLHQEPRLPQNPLKKIQQRKATKIASKKQVGTLRHKGKHGYCTTRSSAPSGWSPNHFFQELRRNFRQPLDSRNDSRVPFGVFTRLVNKQDTQMGYTWMPHSHRH